MSEAPSSSQECNHCNKHVAVVTIGDLVICSECINVIVPAAYSSPPPPPPLSQDLTMEDFTVDLDWGEIFKTTEDNNIEFDDAAYGALVQDLRERDDGVTRGAPPAVESTLETFEVICAVCKDAMMVGEIEKKLLCGHSYHENCIVPWLETINSCPLCRF